MAEQEPDLTPESADSEPAETDLAYDAEPVTGPTSDPLAAPVAPAFNANQIFLLLSGMLATFTVLCLCCVGLIFINPSLVPASLRPLNQTEIAAQPTLTVIASLTPIGGGGGFPTLPPRWTNTPTITPTPTETSTPTETPTVTETPVPTDTPTVKPTEIPSLTPTVGQGTVLPTATRTLTPTRTQTVTPGPSPTRTITLTPTPRPPTNTPTITLTPSETVTMPPPFAAVVRSGPGPNYSQIGVILVDPKPNFLGRDPGFGTWLAINYFGQIGWVWAPLFGYSNTDNFPVYITPTPTIRPTPSITPTQLGRGIKSNYFRLQPPVITTTFNVNQPIWFEFQVVNTTGQTVPYGALGAKIIGGQAQSSWSNAAFQPNAVLTWNDHIDIRTPGTYTLYLAICFLSNRQACEASPTAGWEILSPGIVVTVR